MLFSANKLTDSAPALFSCEHPTYFFLLGVIEEFLTMPATSKGFSKMPHDHFRLAACSNTNNGFCKI